MAIDIHCHLWIEEFLPKAYLNELAKFLADWSTNMGGRAATPEEIAQGVFPEYWDPDGDATIRQMDEAGIEKTVIMPTDFGLGIGEAAKTIEQQNKHLAEVAKKHPDRLVYFFGIDPRREGALELFETSVKEWGAKGLKLLPFTGFYPDEDEAYALVEKASQWNLPLLIHIGPEFPPFDSKYAHPSRLDRILVDFPELPVIAAHLGIIWWRELIDLARLRKNLMCDFSGLQMTAIPNYAQFCHILRRVLDGFGMHRVMFGTDGPPYDPLISKKQWLECVMDLSRRAPEGITFSDEEVFALVHGNAQSLLASTG